MTEVRFTEQQQKAVDSRNKNIIVSAQAGAGKTQVLVARIIKLLEEEEISIIDMLIVTFTNKAAREMKDRIKRDLSMLMQDQTLSEEKQRYFQDQYKATSDAQISTMHSFGINVLRKYFYKLGLNPSFNLVTDTNLDIIQWQTINQVFEDLYQSNDEEFFRLLNIYTSRYDDLSLKQIVFDIYRFMQAQLKPFDWLYNSIEKYHYKSYYENLSNLNNKKEEIFNIFKDDLDNFISQYKEISTSINKINSGMIYIKTLESDQEVFNRLAGVNSYDDLADFISSFEFIKKETVSKKSLENLSIDIKDKDFISNQIDGYRKPLKEYFKNLNLDIEKEIELEDQMKKSLVTIERIISIYDKKFSENKFKKESLDFNDIEHMVLKLLEDDDVKKEISEKYKYIFFDEYQDSNQVQNEIVEKIASKDNLFFVGDIKQSIYKFRLADPLIFKNRYENYKADEINNLAIDLYHNFRTEEKLLTFNNHIFNKIMTHKLGDVDYDTKEHRLEAGKKPYTDGSGKEINPYNSKKAIINFEYIVDDKDNLDPSLPKDLLDLNSQSIMVASKIKEILDRGLKYSDIAILARSKKIFEDITRVLEEEKIPYFYDAQGFSFDDIELQVFIEILKAINNDTNDITLLSALSSTLANMSDNDLAHIRYDDKDHSFYYCYKNYKYREDADKIIIDKIDYYQSKMDDYRHRQSTMSLQDLAWFVFMDSGYMSYILAKANGHKIYANIKLFIEEIGHIEESSYQTLSSLINYFDRIKERSLTDRESNAELSEEDNVVRIMTMHKAKGLQFKAVILVDLNKEFNKMDLSSNVILNDSQGLALKTYDPQKNETDKSLAYKAIAKVKVKELLSEEMRLLYVALTRAVQEMHFISLSRNEDPYSKVTSTSRMKSYHEWIYFVLNGEDLTEFYQYRQAYSSDLYKNFYQRNNRKTIGNENAHISDQEMTEIKDKIDKVINFDYDESLIKIPFKKTVTQISTDEKEANGDFLPFEPIVKEESEILTLDIKPVFEIQEEKITALEKGNLYHYLFENLPKNIESKDQVDAYLQDLFDNSGISKVEFESIDVDLLFDFINTDIYARIQKANEEGKLYQEEDFTMLYKDKGNTIHVDGKIDLYFEEADGLVILDYKTNRKIDEELYSKQLELYAYGLEAATGKKVKEKLIYWVMHGKLTKL